ncbi:MAG: hypothetical protein RSD39_06400 [Oscillospiraceae bacterium]
MTEKSINESLKRAVGNMTPDIWGEISSKAVRKNEGTEIIMDVKKKNRTKIVGLIAAAAAVVVCVFGVTQYMASSIVDSIIDIDVNPSIEITANKKDRVIAAKPLNEDAKAILNDMDLSGVDIDVAVNAITGSMVKNGYFSDGKDSVLVSVRNKDPKKADDLRTKVVGDMNTSLTANDLKANMMDQAIEDGNEEIEANAKKYGLSYGKAMLISKLIESDKTLTYDKLASLTMGDIKKLIAERKIDTKSFVRSDDDDEVYCGDCGKLKLECDGNCGQHGDFCEICGKPKAECSGCDDDDKRSIYCDDCGKLKTECGGKCGQRGDFCEICGKPKAECGDCDKNDKLSKYCDDCGKLKTECGGKCGQHGDFCEICGKPKAECGDCDKNDVLSKFCDDCGKLKTECGGKCEQTVDFCEICGKLVTECGDCGADPTKPDNGQESSTEAEDANDD